MSDVPHTRLGDIVTPWRIGYTVALSAAVLLAVFAFQSAKTNDKGSSCAIGVIQRVIPCPGETDLRQGIIGASVEVGYQAVLFVDGQQIPDDQVRTGGVNQVYFQPGPGTETGPLKAGTHQAKIIYWPVAGTQATDGKSYVWDFAVT